MKPVIVQGDGIVLVIGACSHEHEQVTHGPTTDQINHWCPDCQRLWTTWPERTVCAPAAPAMPTQQSALLQMLHECAEYIAALNGEQDDYCQRARALIARATGDAK